LQGARLFYPDHDLPLVLGLAFVCNCRFFAHDRYCKPERRGKRRKRREIAEREERRERARKKEKSERAEEDIIVASS